MADAELVKQAKTGDKNAIIGLIMARKDEYYRLALIYTGNPEDAMDALQDMTVIAYDKIKQLHKDTAFYSWSMTILINCCRRITRQQRNIILGHQERSDAIVPFDREQHLDLMAALEKLSREQKEAVKLKYLVDLDYETMAQVLKIPVGTAKSRVFNGLRNLKTMLGGMG